MDARSQMLYTYTVSADARLARKCMEDFRYSRRADGMINCSYPNYEENVIPGFGIYYIGMVYDYMMFFGDRERVAAHAETIEGILNFFENHLDARGIVGKVGGVNRPGNYWSFIDWTPEWDETSGVPTCTRSGPITMESLLYVLGLQYAEEIADYLGEPDRAGEYRARAARVQKAVNCHCVGVDGMYQDGPGVEMYSQHCQVFAVLTETVSVECGREYLRRTLEDRTRYAQCSVAMMFYLFRALEKCGLYKYTDGLWDIWRGMVANNMTTCAEDAVLSRSDCHAWGALALYELPAAVLGVRPAKPGFEEIVVRPQMGSLSWARGEVVTPKGMVSVQWSRESDGQIELQVSAPKGVKLRIEKEKIEEGLHET